MAYRETRNGKDTGYFYGEALVTPPGKAQIRFRQRFDTMKAAQGYEVYVKLMGEEPPVVGRVSSGHTFASVAKAAEAKGGPGGYWLAGKDRSVIQRVRHVVSIVGHIDIVDFQRSDFQLIVDDLRKRPPKADRVNGEATLSNSTINRYLQACSAVLTFAVNEGYRDSKPKIPKLPVEENERDILHSMEQEDAVVRVMKANGDVVEALCVRALAQSGMRSSELLVRLRPHQITIETDDEQNEVGVISLQGKQTKGKVARTTYMDPDLAKDVRAVIAAGRMPTPAHLLSTFKKARDACGYGKNLVIHSLRHTANTRMRNAGIDIKIRMQRLGHKNEATSNRYSHVNNTDQLEAEKKLRKARGDRPQNSEVVPFRPKLTG
jgi:integrase